MGNYRFKFSDMIPNAWFYKLKDMNKTPKHYTNNKKKPPTSQNPHNPKPRYFPSEPLKAGRLHHHHHQALADPSPLIKRRDRRRTVYKPSPRVISSIHHHHSSLSPFDSSSPEPPESLLSDSDDDDDEFFNSNTYKCQLSSSTTDIIIDMEHNTRKFNKVHGFVDSVSELDLPPILTKPPKSNHREPRKSFGTSSHGIKLRANSPKIASKKIQSYARKSLSPCTHLKSRNKSIAESFAVVKSSFDPQRDFRDSMVEMIVENNIRSSKELEDLLACYLSLNSNQYHDLIIKAFEQIWIDMTNLRL